MKIELELEIMEDEVVKEKSESEEAKEIDDARRYQEWKSDQRSPY